MLCLFYLERKQFTATLAEKKIANQHITACRPNLNSMTCCCLIPVKDIIATELLLLANGKHLIHHSLHVKSLQQENLSITYVQANLD